MVTYHLVFIACLRSWWFAVVGLRTPNLDRYLLECSILQDCNLENMMSIHQQIWRLNCSVIETVALLLCGVTEHCLAWRQSHRLDKVDDIQAVRKSSADQCNSSGQLLFSVDQWKRCVFHSKILRCLPSAVKNWYLELYSHSDVNNNENLVLGPYLFHPVLSDVIGVTSKYSADSALSNSQSNSAHVYYSSLL